MSKLIPNIYPSLFKLTHEQIVSGCSKGNCTTSPIALKQLEKEFNSFENIDLSNERHEEEMLSLFPEYLFRECNEEDWHLFLSMSRFDRKNNTFVAGCFDNQSLDFHLISYKWRRKNSIKWKTRAGTSPNSTPLIRIHTEEETIYVVEGHRDSLTAILLGLDFIMIPYAGFNLREDTSLQHEVKGRELVFLVEDEPAHKCMIKVANELKAVAESIKLISLGDEDEKVDLSDYVRKHNSIKEVCDGLRN